MAVGVPVVISRGLLFVLILSFLFPISTTVGGLQVYAFDIPLFALTIALALSGITVRFNGHEFGAFLFITLFMIWVVLTATFSLDPTQSISSGLLWVRAMVLFGILIATYDIWYDIRDVGLAALIILIIQGSLALFQAVFQTSFGQLNQYFGTGEVIQSYDRIGGQTVLRSQATLGNPNTLSHWIAVLLPLSLLSFDELPSLSSPRTLLLLLFGGASLLTTQTRGTAIIMLGSGMIVSSLFLARRHLFYFIMTIGGTFSLVWIGGAAGLPYMERFYAITEGVSTRMDGIQESFGVISHYPFTGTGYHMYGLGTEVSGTIIPSSPTRVHNVLLLITAETGIVGGVLFLGVLILTLRPIIWNLHGRRTLAAVIYLYIFLVLIGIMALYTSPVSFQFVPVYIAVLATGVAICSDGES